MREGLRLLMVAGLASASFAHACGGDSEGGSNPKDGGTDASSGGGSGGSAGASGGTAGSGAVGGSSGAAGAGGTTSVPCAPPSDLTKAAVCLLLEPEPMKFLPTDPKLDGKGVLIVQLFDTPQVETPDGGEVPAVATVVLPATSSDGGQSEDTLANVTGQPIRFDNLPMPSALYARALFFDDTAVLASPVDFPVPGIWVAGIDLAAGLTNDPPLQPVAATAGVGTGVTRKLWALRKLTVQISKAAGLIPKGNGQGPLAYLVTDKATLASNAKVFGTGALPCADLSGAQSASISSILFGTGPYWLTAVLDDYGVGSNDLAGAMAALELTGGGPKIPAKNQLTYAPDAYSVAASVQLDVVFDPPDGGSDSVSCGTTDAGGD